MIKDRKELKTNIFTNFVIIFLIFSIAIACLYPQNESVMAEKNEKNIYRNGSKESKSISLMFNVYWGRNEVYQILNILEKYNAKATFFIGGSWADDNVDCLKDMAKSGHEIGNHGYFHKNHSKMSEEDNLKEIATCNKFLLLSLGKMPNIFAPPSGAYNENTIVACEKSNMKVILWSKDTIDWRDKNSKVIYSRATKDIKGGDFVLMHPMKETVEALDDILKYYIDHSFKLTTVSDNIENGG